MLFSKVESETQVSRLTQSTQDQYEVNVRAANIVSCLIEYSHKYVNNYDCLGECSPEKDCLG